VSAVERGRAGGREEEEEERERERERDYSNKRE